MLKIRNSLVAALVALSALLPIGALAQALPQLQVRDRPANDNSSYAASTGYVERALNAIKNDASQMLVGVGGPSLATTLNAPTWTALATTKIANSVQSLTLAGYQFTGDLGRGMPMVAGGTSNGPLAKQSADGRWWNLDVQALHDIPVGYCGALADNSTDNTDPFRTCAAIANNSGKLLRVRSNGGYFRVGRAGAIPNVSTTNCGWVNINTGVIGDGRNRSFVINMSDQGNLFCSNTVDAVQYYGVHYRRGPITPTAGAAIYVDSPPGPQTFNSGTVVRDNMFQGNYNDFICARCNVPVFRGNFTQDYVYASVILSNAENPDNGDQSVFDNTFDAGLANTAVSAVIQTNAGGLRMFNNKIGRGVRCYWLKLGGATAGDTSILKFFGNSCENQTGPSVYVSRDAGSTARFLYLDIHNNELVGPSPVNVAGDFVTIVKVTFNTMQVGINTTPGTGIAIDAAKEVDISGNTFFPTSPSVNNVGVNLGAAVTGRIGPNSWLGIQTPVVNASPFVSQEFTLVKRVPEVAAFNITAGAAKPSGPQNVALFTAAVPNTGAIIFDVQVSGTVSGLAAGSLIRKRYTARNNGGTFQLFNDATSQTLTPTDPNAGPTPYNIVTDSAGGVLTVYAQFNAPAAGSTLFAELIRPSGPATWTIAP